MFAEAELMSAVLLAGNTMALASKSSSSSPRYPDIVSGSSRFLPTKKSIMVGSIISNVGCNFCRPDKNRRKLTAANLSLNVPASSSSSTLLFGGEISNNIFSPTHNPHHAPWNWRNKKRLLGGEPPHARPVDRPNTGLPPMMRKPRWWWRTLATLPYLLPLHQAWMYGETSYNLYRFFEDIEPLTYPFLNVLGRQPKWFMVAYFLLGYLGVVKQKKYFPHFLRFHVIMGLLIDIVLHVVGISWKFIPKAVYWSKTGMHFWVAFCFAFFFSVLECMRCAICGMYAEVPGLDKAAYIQTDPLT